MKDTQKTIRVVLVEDDQDFIYLIQMMLEESARLKIVGVASDAESGIRLAAESAPHLVLMDLNLTGGEMDGIQAGREIRLQTEAKVLFLTCYEEPELIIDASKHAFASGYMVEKVMLRFWKGEMRHAIYYGALGSRLCSILFWEEK